MSSFTFGLDFGTSKTAVALAKTELNAPITDIPIDDQQSKRIPTCVLRRRDTGQVWVGHTAQQEFMMEQDPAARARLEFFSNFKPHIHQNPDLQDIARQFMTAISRSEALSRRLSLHANDAVVAAGYPVSWTEDGAVTLLKILRQAGFPPAFAVPEPVGAALYFLAKGDLRAEDLHRDIVVFDWGAGTFDMTLLRAGSLKFQSTRTWGSNLYGGRLFDDLFYQWLSEIAQRGGRRRELEKLKRREADRAFLHGLLCREIKESFSLAYAAAAANNGAGRGWRYRYPVTIGVGETEIDLGDFIIERIDEFDHRMRTYRASDMALPWFQHAHKEVRPQEQVFLDALLKQEPVDLKAWAGTLIAEGMRELGVGRNAIAVLTGGSCNWKWFKDLVRVQGAFSGRENDIHIDDEPELTIARGLARAYTVGISSTQLVEQISAVRGKLISDLCRIHEGPLEDLSYRINAEMRHDATLQESVQRIFAEAYRTAAWRTAAPKQQDLLKALLDWIRGLSGRVLEDQNEQALRPKLEQSIGDWLIANETKLQNRWGGQFASAARRNIMVLLKEHVKLEGLVEVAIEACGATGPTSFNQALNEIGGNVKFGPDVVSRIYGELLQLLKIVMRSGANSQMTEAEVKKQAQEATRRFFEAMPRAITRNIMQVQSPEKWAQRVVDDLVGTLGTLVAFAKADAAARIAQPPRQPGP